VENHELPYSIASQVFFPVRTLKSLGIVDSKKLDQPIISITARNDWSSSFEKSRDNSALYPYCNFFVKFASKYFIQKCVEELIS